MIYLDNNATTRVDGAVLEAMLPFLAEQYGNPSSMHRFGQEARQAVERGRHQVAGLLDCEAREVVFTSGATESNNAALHGLLAARAPRKVLITSTVEHSAIREPAHALAKSGCELVQIPVNRAGALDVDRLAETLAARAAEVALVSVIWANNETGVLIDPRPIGELCRRHGVPFHVDATQAVGKIAMSLKGLPIDLLSLSGHKFHGPKGAGALFVRRNVRWQPWQRGGPQERDRRGGTENVAGIVGLGRAAELAKAAVEGNAYGRVAELRDRLESQLLAAVPEASVNGGGGDSGKRLPTTANISFARLEAEAILLLLSEQGLCASAGAACSSGSLEPSPVIRAMGIPDEIAHGAIRFSLSRLTTGEEIDAALGIIPPVIERLRATLPV
ncbi:MAG TPA: aminotransferase class V-fold PLP-dependent enzyme [Phycisphaerae bacterium]|nr:aminotransferase class V-fold PLP-dependent enzyme [Phycisphaerae bacterium]